MDRLSESSGPVAGPILDRLRNEYIVDFAHVYGTEITLMLDEDFEPAYFWMDEHGEVQTEYRGQPIDRIAGVEYSEKPAAFIGTLDELDINDDEGKIPDFKSHPAPFEADTFQGKLYSFFVLKHFPHLRKVKFELIFVRYSHCVRSVTYLRSEMADMQMELARAKARQIATHEAPENALALPCTTCTYCPKGRTKTCSIAELNEHLVLTPRERLIRSEWHRRMRSNDMPILKAQAITNGPVEYTDGNGRTYTYGEQEVPSTTIPLDDTSIRLLVEYAEESGENLLDGRLNISSTKLKSLLKTKKRERLRDRFEGSVYQTSTKPQYRVRTADEGLIPEQYDQNYSEE